MEIIDDYEHIEPTLEYVLENVLEESDTDSAEYRALREEYNSQLVNKCNCCPSDNCHGKKCGHGGNYIRVPDANELVLSTKRTSDVIYECSTLCKCNTRTCENRLVQRGPRKNLEIIYSKKYGSQGVQTTQNVPAGAFICEYAGELLTRRSAFQRIADNELHSRMNYILCLNENERGKDGVRFSTIVDPSRRGNIGRYLNHSCDPNCEIFSIRVDCPIPKIGIFAKRDISAGEELTFNYDGDVDGSETLSADESKSNLIKCTKHCLCGSQKCKQFLPQTKF